ncbi:sensor histidine kinase [Kitasatospora purpeofusca]|uniref:sensor histidine kinase n=1 Tax=Kitasatospora purpeofusca TaxID=67352 RepID=UPI002A59BBC1|nr:histidine kinase [Kitasatospora purpeofusca]MDY0813857.1 histidine kinase [Kitasatospora purpeofusca]
MTWRVPAGLWLIPPVALAAVERLSAAGPMPHWRVPLGFATAAILLLRRRFPRTVFLATLPALAASGYFPAMFALYTVALSSTRRRTLTGCAALFVLAWQMSPDAVYLAGDRPVNPMGLIGLATLIAAPIALGTLARTRTELTARIADLGLARERENALLARQAVAAERARLAREIHDTVAHQVSLISVRTAALQVTTTDPDVRETARDLRVLAARTLDELRQMVGVLRASGGTLDTHSAQPVLADLPRLVADSGLDVDFTLDIPLDPAGSRLWPPAVQRAMYRTVQEALTNVRKHAPGARVTLRLHDTDRHLQVDVRNTAPDPAAPFPGLPTGGHGLIGLRERAQLTGGTLTSHPTPDGGYHLHAAFPLTPPEAAPSEPVRPGRA